MFIAKTKIFVKAGNGGNGAIAFHREKYVAAGGPDGGDGGNGGSIVLRVDDNLSTLMDFRYKRKYTAPNGEDGRGARCRGKRGEDLVIKVPRGTVVRDAETNEVIRDMSTSEDFVLCKGGRGGWGNQHFATPTRQVPRFAKAGLPGEEHEVILELKLLADVGLVGFPNVGKSTLLSVTSNAHPKIANYHFTTLYPNLGVIYVDDGVSFVMADIPGIIEGAAEGAGLGHDFLRHIDRCGLHPQRGLNAALGFLVNIFRSIPFIILMVAMLPVAKAIVGTSLGNKAMVVMLIIAAAPYVARMVESALQEVKPGVIEAAQAMGASDGVIIWKVMIPEAKPALITGAVISTVTILGYSAMAGTISGGGLGQIAINYGYQRTKDDIIWICVVLTVVIVQIIQSLGMHIAHRVDKRVRH